MNEDVKHIEEALVEGCAEGSVCGIFDSRTINACLGDEQFLFSDVRWRRGLMHSLKLMLFAPLLCVLLVFCSMIAMGADKDFVMPTLIGLSLFVSLMLFYISYMATRRSHKTIVDGDDLRFYKKMIWTGFWICFCAVVLSFRGVYYDWSWRIL